VFVEGIHTVGKGRDADGAAYVKGVPGALDKPY
jgi:hypothetical protein